MVPMKVYRRFLIESNKRGVETSETEKWTETIFYGKSFWLLVQQPNTFLSTFWFLYPTNCGPITWCLTTNCGRHSSVDPSEPTILRPRVRIASKTSTLFQYFIVEMKNPDFHRTCHFSNGICKLERSWKMVEIVVSRNCIRLKRGRAWPIFQRRNCTCSNSTFVHYLIMPNPRLSIKAL